MFVGLGPAGITAKADVLIVADEFPAMEVLAKQLKTQEGIGSKIVDQASMPRELSSFQAVAVYIHRDLSNAAERAFIDFAQAGGRLVLLHHSISSGKRRNRDWFSFLGVALPQGDVNQGGYKWIEGVTMQCVDLEPHYVMTNRVSYPERTPTLGPAVPPQPLPAFTLHETEVYLNHVLGPERTLLMGLRYIDLPTGKTWVQNTAGWYRAAGKGTVVYFMPGHSIRDFENPVYARIVLNAITAPQAVFK